MPLVSVLLPDHAAAATVTTSFDALLLPSRVSNQSCKRPTGPHLKESGFRSIDLSLALALSLRQGLRRIVARVRGVLGHLPHTAALWLAPVAPTSRA